MKSTLLKHIAYLVTAILLGAFGSSAFAVSTWSQNLVADCTSNATSQVCSGAPAVTVSGWSTGAGTISMPTAGTTFAAATVYNYGASAGLGVVATNESSSSPGPHATDNQYGIDAMLVNFTSGPVNLSSLSIGWNGTDNPTSTGYTDSDLSVLAWTGASTGPTMLGSGLLSSGWTLIGNYANVGSNSGNTQTPITSAIYSSYWLISAYSTAYRTTTGVDGAGLDQGNDAFKVLSIAGNTQPPGNQTPEPGSLALLGAGLLGLMASRRRNQKAASAKCFASSLKKH